MTADLVELALRAEVECAETDQPAQRLEQFGALRFGLGAVASGLLAIAGSLIAICRGADSTLSRRSAVGSGTAAVFFRTHHVGRAGSVRAVSCRGSSVAQYGRSIARHRCKIAFACDRIASSSRGKTCLSGLPAFGRAFIAKMSRHVERGRVAAFGEDAIAGCLITLGRSLIAVGRGLIAVRSGLVSIGQGLVLIGAGLLGLARHRDFLRAVRRSHRMIV